MKRSLKRFNPKIVLNLDDSRNSNLAGPEAGSWREGLFVRTVPYTATYMKSGNQVRRNAV